MAILRIKDESGNVISIPSIKGDKGDKGEKGDSGVYIGSGDMPDNCNLQIDPDGEVAVVVEAPDKAEVGQMLVVKSVDKNGVPTEWECIDVASGGGNGSDGVGIKSIVKTSTSGLVDTYTITFTDESTNTFTITNGADGIDGVSISKTEINSKGELIITLSDNTISNLGVVVGDKGDKGDKGEQGISGVYVGSGDMPEDCDVQIDPDGEILDVVTKEEFNETVLNIQTKDLTFVESVEEMIETTKNYVMKSTGEIWSYGKTTKSYTNQISQSIDADGNIVGLLKNYRYNSSDTLVSNIGTNATGFIPVKSGDVIRFKGIQFRNETINNITPGSYYLRTYDPSFTLVGSMSGAIFSSTVTVSNIGLVEGSNIVDEEGDISSVTIGTNKINGNGYLRMAFVPEDGVEAVITINEEIAEITTYEFQPTGRYYGTESLQIISSTDEMIDISKKYVLEETGTIWRYARITEGYNNLAYPTSSDWLNDNRINSSGEGTTCVGAIVTNYIECSAGDVIRIKGLDMMSTLTSYPYQPKSATYDADKNVGNTGVITELTNVVTATIDSDLVTVNIVNTNIAYMRFCGELLDGYTVNDIVITKNEEIVSGVYDWKDTGIAYVGTNNNDVLVEFEERISINENDIITLEENSTKLANRVTTLEENKEASIVLPAYWEEYLSNKINTIKVLQEAGGKDCFSFPLITDIHITVNLGKRCGLIAKRIMDECYMKYAVCCGDVVSRGAATTEEQMETYFDTVESTLSPLRDRLLQTQGNHDGSWGQLDLDGDGDVEGEEYYCMNYKPAKLYEKIYRKVGLVGDVHFDSTGSGYWIDDISNKVRYIGLNSHCNEYVENEDGTALYNNMRIFRLTQSQFDLTIEALTTVPSDDWAVISFSHAPLNNRDGDAFADRIVFREMLTAYLNKTTYSGTYGTEGNYDYVTVNVDFSNTKGQYIAHFSGHTHTDTVTTDFGIPIITTRCDGHEENDSTDENGLYHERVAGTITEHSFDIFTVNRSERKIYATKIGAGSDREIDY